MSDKQPTDRSEDFRRKVETDRAKDKEISDRLQVGLAEAIEALIAEGVKDLDASYGQF